MPKRKTVVRKILMARAESPKKKYTVRKKAKKEKKLVVPTKNTLPFEIRIFKGKTTNKQYLVYKFFNSYKPFVLAVATDAAEDINPYFKNKKMTTNQMWSEIWRYPNESLKYPPKTQKKRKPKKKS